MVEIGDPMYVRFERLCVGKLVCNGARTIRRLGKEIERESLVKGRESLQSVRYGAMTAERTPSRKTALTETQLS